MRRLPDRVHDGSDIFELPLDGVTVAVPALPPTPSVNSIEIVCTCVYPGIFIGVVLFATAGPAFLPTVSGLDRNTWGAGKPTAPPPFF